MKNRYFVSGLSIATTFTISLVQEYCIRIYGFLPLILVSLKTKMNVQNEIFNLLNDIGRGYMPSIAYDTAWGAMLGDIDSRISGKALEWLNDRQLPDGSWGASETIYYHDRLVSTLTALIAIHRRGRRNSDKKLLSSGKDALNRLIAGAEKGLANDPNGATVGFELIIPALVVEAQELSLLNSQEGQMLEQLGDSRKVKKLKLKQPINRYSTPAFSAEMAGRDISILDIPNLPESNGSIGNSPSATIYFLTQIAPDDQNALAYLRGCINPDGGFPDVAPFDLFEVAWTLWNLALTKPEIIKQPLVLKHVNFLRNAWKPGHGAGFGAGYSVCDGDGSSMVADCLLQYSDWNLDLGAILSYEGDEYFRCYQIESNPSISTNGHILTVLRRYGFDKDYPSIRKLLYFLETTRTKEGYWIDKWHISPYYTTSHIIIACSGFTNGIIEYAIDWLLDTQQEDGSWGIIQNKPTVEETAYCIQSLWKYTQKESYKSIEIKKAIQRGKDWIVDNIHLPFPPLWIGKGFTAQRT